MLGEDVGATALIGVETDPVMSDEHSRPGTGAVGERQVANHRHPVDDVFDTLRSDHGLTVGMRRCSRHLLSPRAQTRR